MNPQHLVGYGRLKEAPAKLDAYLGQLADPWPVNLPPDEAKAALINAYNALTIRWILTHYPVESIWKTRKPFKEPRHRLDGKMVSLDAIETELRGSGDPRIHSVLVCAARSCPPLRREAYSAGRLDAQLDDNTRAWLANPSLNTFDPGKRRASVSSIFKWYRGDFESQGAKLEDFLVKYGPPEARFLDAGGGRIDFHGYHWGLNDASELGSRYSSFSFYRDYLLNR